ncbi:MAG: hypothetical protein Q9222_007365 [Ikaeria aurantiellina]
MHYASTGLKTPNGLDTGPSKNSKKRKRGDEEKNSTINNNSQAHNEVNPPPKILPGERMHDFAARVDLALPVSKGMVGKGGSGKQQSRMEKRMQRMQKEWREADQRRKEKVEEEREEREDEDDEEDSGLREGERKGKGGKKKKRKRGDGDAGEEDDPWAVVAANRNREGDRKAGLVGLHDVVQAPPKLRAPEKKKLDVMDVVRKGGLKRQGELSEARRSVVEGYRKMMRERREGKG